MINNILNLFYPNTCIHCESQLYFEEKILCIHCKTALPIIPIFNYQNNEISNLFFGKVVIRKAYSFLYYRKKNITKKLTTNLKYRNRQDIGVVLGNWIGYILKENNVFDDIDIILPVPLHKNKQKIRGYNQMDTFVERLSSILEKPYNSSILIRKNITKTQTKKSRLNRFINTQNAFDLSDFKSLENKHILLVDDIITTGATLYACCKALQKTKNINISIATIAFTAQN